MARPRPAVPGAVPQRGEQVFVFAQAGAPQCLQARLVPEHVHHGIDGQTADELAAIVDHRRRDEVVALKDSDRRLRIIGGAKGHDLFAHQVRDQGDRLRHQQHRDGHDAAQDVPDINHVQVIGLRWHGVKTPQVGERVADGVAVAHFHPLARHDVTDTRPRKPDAVLEDRAFGLLQPLFDPDPYLVSQRRRHVGQVLGVKPRQHFDPRGLVHPLNQRFAHGL